MSGPRALGILAGGGSLPGKVAAAARAAGRAVFLVGLEGYAEKPVLAPFAHEFVRLGAAGRILSLLRQHGCHPIHRLLLPRGHPPIAAGLCHTSCTC